MTVGKKIIIKNSKLYNMKQEVGVISNMYTKRFMILKFQKQMILHNAKLGTRIATFFKRFKYVIFYRSWIKTEKWLILN